MKSNFNKSLLLVLKHEGGYSDHPKDKGGKTMKGVIQRVYNAYRQSKGLPAQHVKLITDKEVREIYKVNYWDQVSGDKLPSGLDHCVFDLGVNSGPARAKKFLQKAINKAQGRNIKVDGILGVSTFNAIEDVPGIINSMCDLRMGFLRRLWNWTSFGTGWTRRVSSVRKEALAMVGKTPVEPPVVKPEVPKELGKPGDVPKDNTGIIGAIGAFFSAIGAGVLQAVNNPYAMTVILVILLLASIYAYRKLKHA